MGVIPKKWVERAEYFDFNSEFSRVSFSEFF